MAAKRFSKSAINWLDLAERVPKHQKSLFIQFKSKSEGYLKKVNAFPENPPKLDWEVYRVQVPIPGLVDEFKKQYEALKIPYPPNTAIDKLAALEKEIKADIVEFKSESDKRIAEYKKQLDHIAALIPYNEMTMEDYRDAFPEDALDPINRPTFWPHQPEDQLDYVDKDAPTDSH